MAKKKLVTLADVKAAALADLAKEFETNKKNITKAKNAYDIEDNVYASNKTLLLIERFITQKEDCQ
jgi:hypothetical protein